MNLDNRKKKKVVVFVPAYNEEKSIEELIHKIRNHYKNRKEFFIKIVVVDDGSKDRTAQIAKEAEADHIVSHPKNLGLGAATISGLRQAYDMGADIAVKIDADLQYDYKDIEKVIIPILEDKTDLCFGSRFLGKIEYRMPLYRRLGNAFFSFLTRLFTGLKVSDGQTGLIAVNKRYLRNFRLVQNYNETQQIIIDGWRNQLRFMEVPVVFHKRDYGKSFISLRYPFIVLPNILRLFIHSSPLKIFLPVGTSFILISFILGYLVLFDKVKLFGDVSVLLFFISGLQIILYGLVADIVAKKR